MGQPPTSPPPRLTCCRFGWLRKSNASVNALEITMLARTEATQPAMPQPKITQTEGTRLNLW